MNSLYEAYTSAFVLGALITIPCLSVLVIIVFVVVIAAAFDVVAIGGVVLPECGVVCVCQPCSLVWCICLRYAR